jgi:hypothetical protein
VKKDSESDATKFEKPATANKGFLSERALSDAAGLEKYKKSICRPGKLSWIRN